MPVFKGEKDLGSPMFVVLIFRFDFANHENCVVVFYFA